MWCGRSSAATSTSSRGSSRCSRTSSRSGPRTSSRIVDENTIGVAAVLGTTFTGHADDIVGIDALLGRLRDERGLEVPLHVDGASGGFVWPFLYPDSAWDFRLDSVRSINVSGHKYGLVYPGSGLAGVPRAERSAGGPRVLRELPRQARRDVHAELLDRRRAWCSRSTTTSSATATRATATSWRRCRPTRGRWPSGSSPPGTSSSVGDAGRRAAAARRVQARRGAQLRRVRRRVAARRRARLDGARLHAAAERRPRDDHARARQARARPLAGEHAGRRHRAGVRDARPSRAAFTSSTASGSRPARATER